MSDISLNAGIRSNLLSLQASSKLFNRTTERLASGKKVNSAIDNPTNFFASVNLTDRSEGLTARLDGMGQAVQQIKAADNGITTIRSFISAMKGVVNNALANTSADARRSLGKQFNELIVQISQTAKDSGYQGINLLERNETNTVQFSETFDDSTLDVKGFDIRGPGADGRGVVDSNGNVAAAAITAVIQRASASSLSAITASVVSTASVAATASTASQVETGYAATGGSASVITQNAGGTLTAYANTNASQTNGTGVVLGFTASVASTPSIASQTATQATRASRSANSAGTAAVTVALALDTQDDDAVGIQAYGTGTGEIDWGADNYKANLAALVSQIESFDEAIKTQASNLAQNLATITIKEEFSNALINTLNEGSDKLILADLNEEGANLLALQTSNQLATQSLSLASQQAQQVLQLLG